MCLICTRIRPNMHEIGREDASRGAGNCSPADIPNTPGRHARVSSQTMHVPRLVVHDAASPTSVRHRTATSAPRRAWPSEETTPQTKASSCRDDARFLHLCLNTLRADHWAAGSCTQVRRHQQVHARSFRSVAESLAGLTRQVGAAHSSSPAQQDQPRQARRRQGLRAAASSCRSSNGLASVRDAGLMMERAAECTP